MFSLFDDLNNNILGYKQHIFVSKLEGDEFE